MPELSGSREKGKLHIEINLSEEERARKTDFMKDIRAASEADSNIRHYGDRTRRVFSDPRSSAIDSLSKVIPREKATEFVDQLIANDLASHSY